MQGKVNIKHLNIRKAQLVLVVAPGITSICQLTQFSLDYLCFELVCSSLVLGCLGNGFEWQISRGWFPTLMSTLYKDGAGWRGDKPEVEHIRQLVSWRALFQSQPLQIILSRMRKPSLRTFLPLPFPTEKRLGTGSLQGLGRVRQLLLGKANSQKKKYL